MSLDLRIQLSDDVDVTSLGSTQKSAASPITSTMESTPVAALLSAEVGRAACLMCSSPGKACPGLPGLQQLQSAFWWSPDAAVLAH